jgi:hypothetical protein
MRSAGEYLGDRLGGAALVERGDEVLGLIGTSQIRRIPRRGWGTTRTEDAMVPLAKVPWARGDTDLWSALEVLDRSGLDGLLIGTNGDDVSALLTRRSASRLIRELAEKRALTSRVLLPVRALTGRRTPPTSRDASAYVAPSAPPDPESPDPTASGGSDTAAAGDSPEPPDAATPPQRSSGPSSDDTSHR